MSFIIFLVWHYITIFLLYFTSYFTLCRIAKGNNFLIHNYRITLITNTFDTFVLQLSRLLFVECTFDFTLKMFSIAIFLVFLVIMYVSCLVNLKTVSYTFTFGKSTFIYYKYISEYNNTFFCIMTRCIKYCWYVR